MARIKSALELALERTKNLTVDERALRMGESKTEGKKTAGRYLDDPESVNWAAALSAADPEFREQFRKAAFEVLAGQIQLPGVTFNPLEIAAAGTGIGTLAGLAPGLHPSQAKEAAKNAEALVRQISGFCAKYLEELKRVDQAIRTQWAPKLKEKERQLASRMGQDIRMDPMSDPDFAAYYQQNVEAMRANYRDALERAKAELAAICNIREE